MRFGSLFSGIGGFDLGFERTGMECAWSVEKDGDCNRVLTARFPNVKRYLDVTKVNAEELEPVDLICFGWPCQDLSVAGLRAGISGERSGLFREAVRIVAQLRPKWFVAENVPGLHSSFTPIDAPPSNVEIGTRWDVEEDSDFSTVLTALDELGYCVAGRIIDAQYLGVAQRRERVFLVGSLGTTSSIEILFEPESVSGDSPPSREARPGTAEVSVRRAQTSSHGWGVRTDGSTGTLDGTGGDAVIASALTTGTGKSRGPRNGSGVPINMIAYTADVARPLASSGANDHHDESQQTYVTHALRSEGADASEDGTGRGTPIVLAATLNSGGNSGGFSGGFRTEPGAHLVAFSSKDHGADAGEISPTLRSQNFKDSHMNGGGQVAIAFDTTQITSPGNYSEPRENDPCHPLSQSAHPPAVAFQTRIARNGRGQPKDVTDALTSAEGGTHADSKPHVAGNFGVRRLTPRECEFLQGFPADWTRFDSKGKEISDSARYRMLGNAVCVNVAYWIGKRIIARGG